MTKQQIQEEIRKLKDEIKDIYQRAEDVRRNFVKENEITIQQKREKIAELEKSIEPKKRKELEIPENIQEWFRQYTSGINWGYGGIKIVYVSPKQKYVIFSNKGAMGSTGSFWRPEYFPSKHWIVNTEVKRGFGLGDRIMEFEGRLTKEKRQEMINYIVKEEMKQ
jgi:hypothetical protein